MVSGKERKREELGDGRREGWRERQRKKEEGKERREEGRREGRREGRKEGRQEIDPRLSSVPAGFLPFLLGLIPICLIKDA